MTWVRLDWALNEILTAAIKYGYDSVEPRVEEGHKHGIELTPTKKVRKQIRPSFCDTGVDPCCLATSRTLSMADKQQRRESVELTKRFVDPARDLGCPNLRVFGGSTPPDWDFADVRRYVAEALRECAEYAQGSGVSVCLETHDTYCRSADAAEVVQLAAHPQVGICWDILHPFRMGETIAETFGNVGQLTRHCHVHDGIAPAEGGPDGWELTLMGEGQIPHDEPFRLLDGIGFEGAMSGEWIGSLPSEQVLPHEAEVMRGCRTGQ